MRVSQARLREWSRAVRPRLREGAASVLLVPVPEAEFVYERWRGDPATVGVPGLPLHVTVLYPFLHPSFIDSAVERDLQALASSSSRFAYVLSDIGRFPGVLYLTPSPGHRFAELTRAVHARWPSHPPYRGEYHEIVPHVTLALGEEPAGMGAAVAPALPVEAVASKLLLLTTRGDGAWVLRARFPLGG